MILKCYPIAKCRFISLGKGSYHTFNWNKILPCLHHLEYRLVPDFVYKRSISYFITTNLWHQMESSSLGPCHTVDVCQMPEYANHLIVYHCKSPVYQNVHYRSCKTTTFFHRTLYVLVYIYIKHLSGLGWIRLYHEHLILCNISSTVKTS